jgi:uncharacterized membrane protein YeaQ/YmgE (transglycosylase-associated protein family)
MPNFAPLRLFTTRRGTIPVAFAWRPRGGARLAATSAMTITLTGLLILLIIAGICGAIGRAIGGGTRGGFLVSVAVGFVGALLGSYAARALKLPELFLVVVDGRPFPVVWSIIGGALFVAIMLMISRTPSRRYFRYD